MIFNGHNSGGVTLHVIDTGEKIKDVLQCNSVTAEVTQVTRPLRLDHTGSVHTRTRQFSGLWPIYEPNKMTPTMIHCWGEVLQ